MFRFAPGRGLTALILWLGLAGCGFKLAGSADLPESLNSIYLASQDLSDTQRAALIERLERAGTRLSPSPEGAAELSVRLRVIPDRTLVKSASTGKTVERLARRLDYSIKSAGGSLLTEPRSLIQQRDITLDDDNLHSSGRERSDVIRDLEQALFNQLVHQLTRL